MIPAAPALPNSAPILTVHILSPGGVVWEGEAISVSSANSQGPFDLLPQHAHFVSLVEHQPIIVTTKDGDKTFEFDSAVIRLFDDLVTVYADIT